MATFALQRFSSPSVLRAVAPEALLTFLQPHRAYFAGRGAPLPLLASSLDYDDLIRVFISPEADTPHALIDALYLVDEMSTPDSMDALLEAAAQRGLHVPVGPTDPTPSDVAVQVWLMDQSLLERKHAEVATAKVRSFKSYQACDSPPPSPDLSAPKLTALEWSLAIWFELKRRGRAAKVFVCPRGDAVWFLVRHGEPFKREESLAGADTSCVGYRPLRYDVVVYLPTTGELRVNARTKAEKDLYRDQFGKHLFGDELTFNSPTKYTVDPLRDEGEASLRCADVPGIDSVTLVGLLVHRPGNPGRTESWTSPDLFAAAAADGGIPETVALIGATFQLRFTGHKLPRSVKLRLPDVAHFTRDDDAPVVERWLAARGFIHPRFGEGHAHAAALVGGR